MKKNNKTVLIAAAGGLIVVLYNVVLFVLAGFAGHGAAFWSSYALTMVGFVAAALSLYLFTKSNKEHINRTCRSGVRLRNEHLLYFKKKDKNLILDKTKKRTMFYQK